MSHTLHNLQCTLAIYSNTMILGNQRHLGSHRYSFLFARTCCSVGLCDAGGKIRARRTKNMTHTWSFNYYRFVRRYCRQLNGTFDFC